MSRATVKQKKILAVDDDADNLRLVSELLKNEGYTVVTSSDGSDALIKIKSFMPDLVILDINMPNFNGMETLKHLRRRDQYISVIFLSALNQNEDVVRGLDAGADDYITKPYMPSELLARVRAQLRINSLYENLAQANLKLQQLVDIDDVTGLHNMRSAYQRIEREISRAHRYDRAVGLVMMDIDDFKKVNDHHDHLFGSYVLGEIGKIIRDNIRQVDFAARYGGDEFLILLSETSLDGPRLFSERLRDNIEATTFTDQNSGKTLNLTMSLGLVVMEPKFFQTDAKNFIRYADNALYEAKRSGKNCVKVFDLKKLQLQLKKTS